MKPMLVCILLVVSGAIVVIARNKLASDRVGRALGQGSLVVDVRTSREYDRGHFGAAKNIPLDEIERRVGEFGDDKKKTIVVYCLRGTRAAAARRLLLRQGFVNVINAGGVAAMERFARR